MLIAKVYMNKTIYFLTILLLFTHCKSSIKNVNATVVQESGTEVTTTDTTVNSIQKVKSPLTRGLYGFWVGYFEKGDNFDYEKDVATSTYQTWYRENKINISIDSIKGDSIIGHSVVAGNDRPFKGTVKVKNEKFYFQVKEPGNNRYDGVFTFVIKDTLINEPSVAQRGVGKDTILEGTWEAFKKIDIYKRKYTLRKQVYTYDPNIMLVAGRFVDWEKRTKKTHYDKDMDEWGEKFVTATNAIFEINASNKLLTEADVENLKKGDLYIIRNTIYARHGYSFKNRPLRVFFDTQSWYIPVYANIKNDFTEIEKKNIQLLLRYEKNAKEYYDYFGRG